MLPNYHQSISVLYDQYGHVLSENATVMNVVYIAFVIGIGIGMYYGVKKSLSKDDQNKPS